MLSSTVRSKIASFEAESKEKGGLRASASPSTSTASVTSAGTGNRTSTKGHGSSSPVIITAPGTFTDTGGSGSTAVAAQSRVTRMRQEQMTRDGKSHQANLIEKRKLLKERRMLQQKRNAGCDGPDNDTLPAPMDKRVKLPHSTDHTLAKCLNKPSLPGSELAMALVQKEMPLTSGSPSRGVGGASRLSKMQRMQKMKGFGQEHSKYPQAKAHLESKKEAGAAEVGATFTGRPSVAPSAASTATTAVAQNSANTHLQRRQRQTTAQSRAKRGSDVNHNPLPATLDTLVGSAAGKQQIRTASNVGVNVTISDNASPQPKVRSFVNSSATSPNSDFEALSDNNNAYGVTDRSVEPTTDDEATLTSVRQIMTRENSDPSPRDKSHHYQHLQAQTTRVDDSTRSGRTIKQKSAAHARKRTDTSNQWPQGKSNNAGIPEVFRVTSSSDYDTDGDISKTSRRSNVLDGPSHSHATDVNEIFTRSGYAQAHRRIDDEDDRTFDYGDRDDDSNGSASFALRQRRRADPTPPEAGAQRSTEEKEIKAAGPSSLINKDDVEHYTRSLGSPAVRVAAGLIGAVTVGCIVLGPAGLLAGAAVVGLGIGAMQIPEEERLKIQAKVHKAVNNAHEKAIDATEALSNTCAATYEESGVAEHLPPCLSLPSSENVVAKDQEATKMEKGNSGNVGEASSTATKGRQRPSRSPPSPLQELVKPRSEAVSSLDRPRNKKVAFLRNGMLKGTAMPYVAVRHVLISLIAFSSNPSSSPDSWTRSLCSTQSLAGCSCKRQYIRGRKG